MTDKWILRGTQFTNCNCDYGCPCQFGSPTTHGHCEAVITGFIEEGHFNDTRLDGLNYAMLLYWPGEIADGNGKQRAIIDERANAAQREALRKILHGESTKPGATHFHVFNSTMAKVLEPIYAPISLFLDVDLRQGSLRIPGIVESTGTPLISAFTGQLVRSRIQLPAGFEYDIAEVASGTTKAQGEIALDLSATHGHFNILHMTQDGVVH